MALAAAGAATAHRVRDDRRRPRPPRPAAPPASGGGLARRRADAAGRRPDDEHADTDGDQHRHGQHAARAACRAAARSRIALGAFVVLGGISYFIWRDARRRAPVAARADGERDRQNRPGFQGPPKARKLSAAERKRRKRGRAKR